LAKAELRDWEQIVAADAQRYLQSGGAAQVLKLFASRTERSADSPCIAIEAEAHRLLGDDQAARECAVRGIAAAAAAGHNELALDLNLLIAAIDEGAGNLEAALARLEAARALTDLPTSTTSLLRLAAARIRIRRLLGEAYDGERAELAAGTNALLTPPVLVELRGSPALLRELVPSSARATSVSCGTASRWSSRARGRPDQLLPAEPPRCMGRHSRCPRMRRRSPKP